MRARRKGTNNPYTRVDKVQLQDLDILYNADVMEFEPHSIEMPDTLSTELKTYEQTGLGDYWQEVRVRASIAVMQGLLTDPSRTGIQYAETSVAYADALIKKLKESN